MLELINIYKSFTHTGHFIEVLKGIDLTVNPGESLSVTGASGVGKSTLLNIMGTLEPPTEGVVRFDSLNVNELDGAALCRLRNRDIGLVFQFHHLLPEFNALENTLMPGLIARSHRNKAMERPKLLLADEPTGNLDRVTGEGIMDLLLRLNREEGLALVIATHNQRLAEKMSRQMEIVDGRIL
jgi:lipoprotein-releasing system ATP-binding protein